jgi:hypothetical protein
MNIRIDIRTEVFDIREATAATIEKAMLQVQQGVHEIVAEHDYKSEAGRQLIEMKVSKMILSEAKRINSTGHMTDSVEGFINAQIVKKLVNEAAEPGSMIVTAIYS